MSNIQFLLIETGVILVAAIAGTIEINTELVLTFFSIHPKIQSPIFIGAGINGDYTTGLT